MATSGRARLFAFVVVGASAALLHFIVVSLLVPAGLHPLLANIAGFGAAFVLSYTGHATWTFPANRARPRARYRFFAVALTSFAANELLYAALLRFTHLGYLQSLLLVLILVAIFTFLASKHWAFASDHA